MVNLNFTDNYNNPIIGGINLTKDKRYKQEIKNEKDEKTEKTKIIL